MTCWKQKYITKSNRSGIMIMTIIITIIIMIVIILIISITVFPPKSWNSRLTSGVGHSYVLRVDEGLFSLGWKTSKDGDVVLIKTVVVLWPKIHQTSYQIKILKRTAWMGLELLGKVLRLADVFWYSNKNLVVIKWLLEWNGIGKVTR